MTQDGGVCRHWPHCSVHDGSHLLPTNMAGRSPRAKLKPSEVVLIRKMVSSGALHREAAARFGVKPETVSAIIRGRTWRWLDEPRS